VKVQCKKILYYHGTTAIRNDKKLKTAFLNIWPEKWGSIYKMGFISGINGVC
jgi:hypothetical protein